MNLTEVYVASALIKTNNFLGRFRLEQPLSDLSNPNNSISIQIDFIIPKSLIQINGVRRDHRV